MHNALAIARRILSQFIHDKRTLVLLFLGPIFVLWLLSVMFNAGTYSPRIATIHLPSSFQTTLEDQDAYIQDVSEIQAERLLINNDVDAVLRMSDNRTLSIWTEGSDSSKTAAVVNVVHRALSESQKQAIEGIESDIEQNKREIEQVMQQSADRQLAMKESLQGIVNKLPPYLRSQFNAGIVTLTAQDTPSISLNGLLTNIDSYMPIQDIDVSYLHGSEDWKMFDYYGPVFIGLFLFVFVFLTSGMSLVNERSSGTMTRFLATPVKSRQVLGGYTIGFGLLALVQVSIILWVALTFIGFPNEGSLGLVVLTGVSMALVSVTLGLLVSGLASNPFQVIQLMLLFVVPQILLSGLFDLSSTPLWLQIISQCLPVTYGVDALRSVMLQGASFAEISKELLVLWGFIIAFFVLASLSFRKKSAKV